MSTGKDTLWDRMDRELGLLKGKNNFRLLPRIVQEGRMVKRGYGPEGGWINFSSNDYLGLAADRKLREDFRAELSGDSLFTASSSRLLTGSFPVFERLESTLAGLYGAEAGLVFNSGYHANTGILPAISDARTLLLADKLVHARLIDGIRLSSASCIRYQHNDYGQLERLVQENYSRFDTVIIVTESIFSMDGDEADLSRLCALKRQYNRVLLYLDEAHAFGVRGKNGLGCAEEKNCVQEIDFLVGTFGKALASAGAFVVCRKVVRDYLINRMRTFIFTTALPPVLMEWSLFLVRRLPGFDAQRERLARLAEGLCGALREKGYSCPSSSHIIPLITGDSAVAVHWAAKFQQHGFYVLPVRPPTVPEGTSRIRFSLRADVTEEELKWLIDVIPSKTSL